MAKTPSSKKTKRTKKPPAAAAICTAADLVSPDLLSGDAKPHPALELLYVAEAMDSTIEVLDKVSSWVEAWRDGADGALWWEHELHLARCKVGRAELAEVRHRFKERFAPAMRLGVRIGGEEG